MRYLSLILSLLVFANCGDSSFSESETPIEVQEIPSLAKLREKEMQAKSPDGQLHIAFTRSETGQILYQLSKNGITLISPSSLGFTLKSQGRESKDFAIEEVIVSQGKEAYDLPWGIVASVNAPYSEIQLSLKHVPKKFKFKVQARIFDDGLGIRYLFPKQMNSSFPGDTMRIIEEHTQFNVVGDPLVNWGPGDWISHENPLELTLRSEIDATKYDTHKTIPDHMVPNNALMTPMTMRLDSGIHLSIHEAGPTAYPDMTLAVTETGFVTILEGTEGRLAKAVVKLPFTTPWRTIAVEDRAVDMVTNMLAVSLSDSNSYLRNPYRFDKTVAQSIATEYDTLADYSQASNLVQLPSIAYTRGLDSPFDFSSRFHSLNAEGKTVEEVQDMIGAFLGACVVLHAPGLEKIEVPSYFQTQEAKVTNSKGKPIPHDIIESLERNSPLHRYAREVATAWDDTYPLAGELGEYVVVARKVKGKDLYFIGGVAGNEDREIAVVLDFLQDSLSYELSLFSTPEIKKSRKNKALYKVTNSFVNRGDTLRVTMKQGSGFGGTIGMGVAE